MEESVSLVVNRANIASAEVVHQALPDTKALAEGEVLLAIDQFALTANNITYAALGDMMGYWQFFPTTQDTGIVPVWGFADVVASASQSIQVGERLYGFYPMATHLTVQPDQISEHSFIDASVHRQTLPAIYNQYIRCAQDPLYTVDTEALQMLLRPLFTTSFLLDDFFADNEFFGAKTLVLTSASSKTALGMAFLLNHNRSARQQDYEVVGLTSPGNVDFVESLSCYDSVLSYGQLKQLDTPEATAIIDFAGNAELLASLHQHFSQQLQYSCRVGASHWDQGGPATDMPGPEPQMFFAPSQAQKRVAQWGGAEFQQRLATVWHVFLAFVDGWVEVEHRAGPEQVANVYGQMLSGDVSPKTGHILTMLKK